MTDQDLYPDICGYCGWHRVSHGLGGECDGKHSKDAAGADIDPGHKFSAWVGIPGKVYIDRARQDVSELFCGGCSCVKTEHMQNSVQMCGGSFKQWNLTTRPLGPDGVSVRRAMQLFPVEFGMGLPAGSVITGLYYKPEQAPVPWKMRTHLCECGAWSLGVQDRAYGHSTWCAVASKTLPKDLLR
jgi:hypothetical protein